MAASSRLSVRRQDALCFTLGVFALGVYTGRVVAGPSPSTAAAPSPPTRSQFEERGPPTKQELGQAGWTLLHVMAANYPETPTDAQQERATVFLHALGHLYPCPTCASHFRQHYAAHSITAASRTDLSLWLCRAHNEVNVRNGKEEFYCDIGVLDARWKDCGCGKNSTATPVVEAAAAERDVGRQTKSSGQRRGRRGGSRRQLHAA